MGEKERERKTRREVMKIRMKRRNEGQRKRDRRGEVIAAINRTGTQPVDSSRVTFAREREATSTSTTTLLG